MLLCRDVDMIQSKTVKKVFEFLDYDKNGLLTEDDLEQVLSPNCVTVPQIDNIFREVSHIIQEDVKMTGITILQFRHMILN